MKKMYRQSLSKLGSAISKAQKAGTIFKYKVEGTTDSEIVKFAQQGKFDMIVNRC